MAEVPQKFDISQITQSYTQAHMIMTRFANAWNLSVLKEMLPEEEYDNSVMAANILRRLYMDFTGAADAGLIAYALALSPRLEQCCEQAPIPADLHQPLRQRGALIEGAGEAAERLYAFILGSGGRRILERHGFGIPPRD